MEIAIWKATHWVVLIIMVRTYNNWVVVSNMFAVFYTEPRDPRSDGSASGVILSDTFWQVDSLTKWWVLWYLMNLDPEFFFGVLLSMCSWFQVSNSITCSFCWMHYIDAGWGTSNMFRKTSWPMPSLKFDGWDSMKLLLGPGLFSEVNCLFQGGELENQGGWGSGHSAKG